MSWECISKWIEGHSGLAIWLQSIGVLLSIWIAWLIARSQAKKIERSSDKLDKAKCGAVIGVLKHAKGVFVAHSNMSNDPDKIAQFKLDLSRITLILEGVDLFSLPSLELITAICNVRQALEKVQFEFRDARNSSMTGIHFRFGVGKTAMLQLDKEIESCEKVLRGMG